MPSLVITEINFIPVRPQKGLIGFVSFVYNNEIYFGNIAVFSRINQTNKPSYRLAYPEDQRRKTSFFHPINKQVQQSIEDIVSAYIEDLFMGMPVNTTPEDEH